MKKIALLMTAFSSLLLPNNVLGICAGHGECYLLKGKVTACEGSYFPEFQISELEATPVCCGSLKPKSDSPILHDSAKFPKRFKYKAEDSKTLKFCETFINKIGVFDYSKESCCEFSDGQTKCPVDNVVLDIDEATEIEKKRARAATFKMKNPRDGKIATYEFCDGKMVLVDSADIKANEIPNGGNGQNPAK